ncbi:MAG: cytochrome c biogenesis protein CcdA [Actinomycetes bacterium]
MLIASAGVGLPLAFLAGLVSFLSPCVLPLVPGYLSAIAGVTPADIERTDTRRVLVPSLIFVGTFSTIFILLGLTATRVGSWLNGHQSELEKVSAVLIIALGLLFVLSPLIPQLAKEWHPGGLIEKAGRGGPAVAGAAFAIAWTPCIGPTLSAILATAAISGSAAQGALLLAFYSLGLAIPFILTALAFGRMTTAFAVIKRHYTVIVVTGGVVLIALGILIWTGEFFRLNAEAQGWLQDLGLSDPGSI